MLVGVNTVIRDDPKLTVRRVDLGKGKQPLRIVLDRRLRTPEKAEMVTDGDGTVVLHCEGGGGSLECETILIPPLFSSDNEGVDLLQLLDLLGDREVQRLLVEGGPDVWARFLNEKLVDEACIFHSKVDLGEGLNGGITTEILEGAGLKLVSSEDVGGDRLERWLRA